VEKSEKVHPALACSLLDSSKSSWWRHYVPATGIYFALLIFQPKMQTPKVVGSLRPAAQLYDGCLAFRVLSVSLGSASKLFPNEEDDK